MLATANHSKKATKAAPPNRPLIVLIPGGPGLSSGTLGSLLDEDSMQPCLSIDPPGTGASPAEANYDFEGVVIAIEDAILRANSEGRKIVLLGHSFGGLYVARLFARGRLSVHSLVFLSAPMSVEGYAYVGSVLGDRHPPITAAAQAFMKDPSEANFRHWLDVLCDVYFSPSKRGAGRSLILADRLSPQCFLQVYAGAVPKLAQFGFDTLLHQAHIPKLMIAGAEDQLAPPEQLKAEAARLGAEFCILPNVGHFGGIDNPSALGALVREFVGR